MPNRCFRRTRSTSATPPLPRCTGRGPSSPSRCPPTRRPARPTSGRRTSSSTTTATGCSSAPGARHPTGTGSIWPSPTTAGPGPGTRATHWWSTGSRPATPWSGASATGGSCTTQRPARQPAATTSSSAIESDDLVHWSGRRVVYTDELVGTLGGPTESPFVVGSGRPLVPVLRAERVRGGVGPHAAWRGPGLAVGLLDDPRARERRPVPLRPGERRRESSAAHAAEVVVDEEGATWVSHCGWGQGGVYLAPLRWT